MSTAGTRFWRAYHDRVVHRVAKPQYTLRTKNPGLSLGVKVPGKADRRRVRDTRYPPKQLRSFAGTAPGCVEVAARGLAVSHPSCQTVPPIVAVRCRPRRLGRPGLIVLEARAIDFMSSHEIMPERVLFAPATTCPIREPRRFEVRSGLILSSRSLLPPQGRAATPPPSDSHRRQSSPRYARPVHPSPAAADAWPSATGCRNRAIAAGPPPAASPAARPAATTAWTR